MNLDLIKYRNMIGKKLCDQIDKRIAQGSGMGNVRNNVRYATPTSDSDSDSDSELDLNAIKGGKFNFVKSIKKLVNLFKIKLQLTLK